MPNTVHTLKTIQPYFNFEVGDILELQEYDPSFDSLLRKIYCEITCVTIFPDALKEGYVMLSFKVLSMEDDNKIYYFSQY